MPGRLQQANIHNLIQSLSAKKQHPLRKTLWQIRPKDFLQAINKLKKVIEKLTNNTPHLTHFMTDRTQQAKKAKSAHVCYICTTCGQTFDKEKQVPFSWTIYKSLVCFFLISNAMYLIMRILYMWISDQLINMLGIESFQGQTLHCIGLFAHYRS